MMDLDVQTGGQRGPIGAGKERQRQAELHEFKAHLIYIDNSRPVKAT